MGRGVSVISTSNPWIMSFQNMEHGFFFFRSFFFFFLLSFFFPLVVFSVVMTVMWGLPL